MTPERPPSPAERPPSPDTAKGAIEIVELSHAEQTTARRVAESRATIPDLTVSVDVDTHAWATLLQQPDGDTGAAGPPTHRDLVVKACGMALREHPRVNATYRDGRLYLHGRVNVGVTIASGAEMSPTPTIFDADLLSLTEIANQTRSLQDRARRAAITPPELAGATFTVADLPNPTITAWETIVTPPQVAVLALGAVLPRVVVHSGEASIRETMTLALSCDARAVSPAQAAHFLARVRELLEAPTLLMG